MLVPIPFDEKIFKAITSNIIDVEFYLLKKVVIRGFISKIKN